MITWEQIQDVNSQLKTIDQKGKPYVTVDERVKAFRKLFPDGTIETEMLYYQDGRVLFRATAYDDDGHKLATGHAEEIEGAGYVNKTSYVENCETSAVGRCLGLMYLGADGSIASYDEVETAKEKQKKGLVTWRSKLISYCKDNLISLQDIAGDYDLKPGAPDVEYKRVYEALTKERGE